MLCYLYRRPVLVISRHFLLCVARMAAYKLWVKSATQIVQVSDNGARALPGKDMQKLAILEASNGEGLSLVVDSGGLIAGIGTDQEIQAKFGDQTFSSIVDATGRCIMPGFCDAHTHPVWAGDRVDEFAMKLAGLTYMEIHAAGGGIHSTVKHTCQADEDYLYQLLQERLRKMMCSGTTLVECKSGYGLDAENEIKMLKVIERVRKELRVDISSTYCGAHAVPQGKTAEEATNNVIHSQLPAIGSLMTSGELHVDNIDVFCEHGVFDVTQTRKILLAGKEIGLAANFHGEELHQLKSAEMGAELGAQAISHLEKISERGITAMATAGTVGVVLPTTAYILRLNPPPVRKMIDGGMIVALGTDFNPNAYCISMPLVMHLACVTLHMSMPEALAAATLNAAAALGKSHLHGSLEVGKVANILIINSHRWEHLIYQLGCHDSLIDCVIWHGDIVHQARRHSKTCTSNTE